MFRGRPGTALIEPWLVAVGLVAFVALPACSGGNGGSSGDVGNLSRAAFAKKANALCATADGDRTKLVDQLPPSPSGPADAEKLQSVVTIDREVIRHVDALVPPQSEQDSVDRVLDAWRQRATIADQYANAVGAMQDPGTLAAFNTRITQIDAATDPVAVQLGIQQCARGPH